MMENKEKFIKLLNSVKREGIDKLIAWLEKSDFFSAPASAKFHSNYEGGLCDHSLKVLDRFEKLLINEYGKDYEKYISKESIIVCSLMHDVCKANYYKTEMRNVKVDGTWIQQPYYSVDDSLPYGHGEKSVYIVSGFIKLTREEAMIINWHMGSFDERVKNSSSTLSKVYYMYPNAFLFHNADMQATYLDEKPE